VSSFIEVDILVTDALTVKADVLAVKYAQDFYGLDGQVALLIETTGGHAPRPQTGSFGLVREVRGIAADHILFIGVEDLWNFRYPQIRGFGKSVLTAAAKVVPECRHMVLSLHGAGYGLDEQEAFRAEIAGFVDAIDEQSSPTPLEKITIAERNAGRARRLRQVLKTVLPNGMLVRDARSVSRSANDPTSRLSTAGSASESKAHVFVAMPFKEDMDDVYDYGIANAVNATGLLCERADLSSFMGDVLEWVRGRIKSASLVIADLTDANPNVYLEVGYAWGCGVPTILVVKDPKELKFDVRGQRCLVYRKIRELEELLRSELQNLKSRGAI
jgi:hypothetical protein